MAAASEPAVFYTLLDTYAHTSAIKSGAIASPRMRFAFSDILPISSAFGKMAEHQEFDISEMSIVTFIQALALGKPLLLLPTVMMSRIHHGAIICRTDSAVRAPGDLAGKRIGVRSYTQTTGVWARGIYHAEYGLDLDGITNVTVEAGHLDDYVEPPNVERTTEGKKLETMLLDGEIDAWIAGRDAPKRPEFRPVLSDADATGAAWFERTRAFPINHMVTITRAAAEKYPWLPAELFALLKRGKEQYLADLRAGSAPVPKEPFFAHVFGAGIDPLPFGVEALRGSLEVVIAYAFAQKLIPRMYAVDELFDPLTRDLV
jgi:4,5-dihydroxyphthalate decarboxylase